MLRNQPSNPTVNICSSEKIPSMPSSIDALDRIDLKSDFVNSLRNNSDLDVCLKAFSLGLWFFRQAMLDDSIKFFKVKQIQDLKIS
jgi:hypothetical protein